MGVCGESQSNAAASLVTVFELYFKAQIEIRVAYK